MALGNTNTQSNKKLYILKIKNKILDGETNKEVPVVPHVFQVTEKVDGKWVARSEYINQFSGDLAKIDFEKAEWEGQEYHVIKLFFEDNDNEEAYMWDARCGADFRSAANSLLALDPSNVSNIRISTYKTTSKKNGKDYSNVSVWQGDTHIKGKFTWEQMPPVEKVKFKGKDMSDTTKLDDFIIEKLKEFAAQIGKTHKKAKSAPAPAPESEVNSDIDPEDVPFNSPR